MKITSGRHKELTEAIAGYLVKDTMSTVMKACRSDEQVGQIPDFITDLFANKPGLLECK